ncbi:MAG: hypothetical protein ABSA90_12500 [Xanthobacteraceae bacterium]|jgi:hypothetical protein
MSDDQKNEEVVTKARFAQLTRVSAPRVSQWIAEEKISGDALVGEGRGARIRVAVAISQLQCTLDPVQRALNGANTNLDISPPARGASQIIQVFLSAAGELALSVAVRFNLPPHDVERHLRGELRKIGARAARQEGAET